MITDPNDQEIGIYRVSNNQHMDTIREWVTSSNRGRCPPQQHSQFQSVRIVMNVTDMKALMETNHDH